MESKNLDLMQVFNHLRVEAASVGTNLSKICDEAGVPRNTVEQWKKRPPRAFSILHKLTAAIDARRNVEPAQTAAE